MPLSQSQQQHHHALRQTRPSLFWLIVNSICCAYSIQLLIIIFIDYAWKDEEETHGMIFAKESFMLYDFSTTFIWCFELVLRIHSMLNNDDEVVRTSDDGRLLNDNGEVNATAVDGSNDDSAAVLSDSCCHDGRRWCGRFHYYLPSWIYKLTKQQIQVGLECIIAMYFLYDTAVTYYNLDYQVENVAVMTISAGLTFVAYLYMIVKEYPKIQRMITVASSVEATRSASNNGYDNDGQPTTEGAGNPGASYELSSSTTPMMTSYQIV